MLTIQAVAWCSKPPDTGADTVRQGGKQLVTLDRFFNRVFCRWRDRAGGHGVGSGRAAWG